MTKHQSFSSFSTITSAILVIICLSGCKSREAQELRVLTYNLHHGESIAGVMDVEAMAEVIRSAQPHLVALQEVDVHTNRVGGISLMDQLATSCRMQAYFAKAMDYDGGAYGNGILSAFSIVGAETHLLPSSDGHEQRAAASCLIALPGDTIRFISTHFDHVAQASDRVAQARELTRLFVPEKQPSILAGDLNDTPESEALQILKAYWSTSAPDSAYTIPVPNPTKKIDYILYHPTDRWRVKETRVLPAAVSDHYAVLTVFQLN